MSPESKYLRFFAPYPKLSQRDVQRFTEVDYVDRVAFIVTLGDQMIAVGRYDRTEDDEAEVAFLIEDAHQGRGIAQLLLEHLAEAARERGITGSSPRCCRRTARMAQVFADAGYRMSRRASRTACSSCEFPILPTDTSVGVMERREHRAESASMRRLLHPAADCRLRHRAHRVQELVNSMLAGGFRGDILAVSTDDRDGRRRADAPPSLATLPAGSTSRSVSVPTRDLGGVVIDAAHKGAHGMVVLTGTDVAGRGQPDRGQPGPGVRGPRARSRCARPDQHRPEVAAQRHARARCRAPAASACSASRPRSASRCSTTPSGTTSGCRRSSAPATTPTSPANDVMQYWEDDEATRVCLLSLDSIGNPRKFSRITRRLARRKPVVVLRPGPDQPGLARRRPRRPGHAPDEAVDALFRQAGVMVVHRRGAMFDIAKIAARQPLPSGPRVAARSRTPRPWPSR